MYTRSYLVIFEHQNFHGIYAGESILSFKFTERGKQVEIYSNFVIHVAKSTPLQAFPNCIDSHEILRTINNVVQ